MWDMKKICWIGIKLNLSLCVLCCFKVSQIIQEAPLNLLLPRKKRKSFTHTVLLKHNTATKEKLEGDRLGESRLECLGAEWAVLAHEYKALYYCPPSSPMCGPLPCPPLSCCGGSEASSSDGMNATCQRQNRIQSAWRKAFSTVFSL